MYKEMLNNITTEYERKRDRALHNQRIRKQKIYKNIPAIRRIDEEIVKTGLSMTKYIIGNPEKYKEVTARAKK